MSGLFKSVASVLATFAASAGASFVGFIQGGIGAILRTLQDKARETVSVQDFGLNSANTAAQNKAAFQAAIASLTRPGYLKVPAGLYSLTPDIDLGNFVLGIEGDGKYATQLSMTGGTKCFYSNANPIEFFRLKNIGLFATTTNYGLYAATMNHSQVENCLFTGFTSEAVHMGGYSNDIVGCDIFSNPGSGIYLTGTLNNVNVVRNRIYANTGIGILVASTDSNAGLQINIEQNAIEGNAVAGIVALNTKALNIKDNYFERNAATGYAYGNPEAITIYADIHLLSDSAQTILLNAAYSNKGPTISGNHSTPNGSAGVGTANLDGFIFTNLPNSMRVENNQMFDNTKLSALVCLYANNVYSTIGGRLVLTNNSTNTVGYKGTLDVNNQRLAATHLIDIETSDNLTNYANKNFLTWIVLAGSTGTLVRSGNFWNGQPSFGLTDGDIQWGNVIDLTVYQELRGKWVYFGMWVNDLGNNTNARLTINGQSSRTITPAGGLLVWQFQSVLQFIGASDTTVSYGVTKIGTGGTQLINNPIFAVVGDSYSKFPTILPQWAKSSMPTTGSWVIGDRVVNYSPTVGQPKAWTRITTGSGNVLNTDWVSEGNL